ncbi:hypothetical protein Agabi119p4_1364 [Agaricus bisporus var. burnettii]|uniref:Rgp1-domain-containing protein n=1 Tax=Agaricus bisporus var. burnettii TaxID=192524 RepID=A0A8H7KMR9_AGABI|nr:hypothetical protein Agabi119p4_1364 [Agaricus bisporus var. burnettii]
MPVRVEISPSQSSFFAGEPFSAKITFTNVAAPEPSPARSHKRGAHSISSAPLARPPTSPGLPPRKSSAFARDAIPVRRGLVGSPIAHDKQLFIETRQSPIPASLSRTNTLPLSSDHPHARKPSLIDGQLDVLSPSISLNPISESSRIVTSPPSTPRVSSPLSPSYSHPPFQSSPSPNTVQAYPSIATTPRPFYSHHRRFSQHIGLGHPPTPQSAFTSTFPTTKSNNNTELVLYSYAQLVGTAHILPEIINNNNDGIPQPTTEQKVRLNRIRKMLIGRRAVVGGGSMDISRSMHRGNGLGGGRGGLQPQPQPISRIKLGAQQQQQRQQHTRSTSFSQSLISLISPTPSSTTNNPSFKSSSSDNVSMPGGGYGLGLGLGISSNTSNTSNNHHNNNNNNMNNYPDEIIDPELALPTFEAQPTMLAVDLRLAPGESKTYTYSIKLPEILPPTYKGRTLSFSYELVVGTCRASSTLPTATSRNLTGGDNGNGSVSRVMKVPIRVYNHVSVDCPMRVYDVLWPVMHNRRRRSGGGGGKGKEVMVVVGGIPEVQGRVVEEKDDEEEEGEYWDRKTGRRLNGTIRGRGKEDELSLDDLRRYSERLLNSLPPLPRAMNGNAKVVEEEEEEEIVSPQSFSHSQISSSSSLTLSDSSLPLPSQPTDTRKAGQSKMEEGRRREEEEDEEEEEEQEDDKSGSLISGCREAVEILTRVPKKASYDVNKEGTRVAVLTFTKSAYRLGETVVGVVEVNERIGRTRVLQLSAILEAHEVLPKSIIGTLPPQGGPGQAGRGLKKAYAEHYAAFTSNMLRTTFALDIPSDASPAFRVKIDDNDNDNDDDEDDNNNMGGLEWKIRLCLLVAVASEDSDKGTEGVMFRCLERDGGRGEWGSAWCAPKRFVPLEKKREKPIGRRKEKRMVVEGEEGKKNNTRSWTRVLVDSMWNAVSGLGIEEDDEEEEERQRRRKGNGWYIGKNEQQQQNDITTTSTNYDGIKPDLAGGIGRGVDFSGDDENNNENENEEEAVWKEVKLETVECEVPIRVWPGNTAFRAVDVVFDV